MNKKSPLYIVIVIAIIILLVLLIFFIKDKIVSYQLTKMYQMPVNVRGINLNLKQIFTAAKKLEVDLISFGEDETQINFKNLKFDSIAKNSRYPEYCFDGMATFEKVYMGEQEHGACSGNFHVACIPYKQPRTDINPSMVVNNGKVRIKDTYLTINATINTPSDKISRVHLTGNLERTYLANILACMNAESEEVKSDIQIPSFQANLEAGEKIDPAKTLVASGNFILYQGQFTKLDLLKPILDTLKLSSGLDSSQRKNFDQVTGNFNIANEMTHISDINYNSNYLALTGAGTVDFLGNLNFQAKAKPLFQSIPSKEIQSLSFDSILPQGSIYLQITGTAEKPKVRPDLKAAAIDTVKTKVLGNVEDRVDKALTKIFN